MYKLLIVDDEETILEGIMTAVPWAEFDVSVSGTARNGLEALAFLEAETVDIILTDISMPLMDGLELAKTVRQRWPQVHVMILTGYDEFDYARRAIEYGVDAFLLKPVGIEELEEQLGRIKIKIREKKAQDRRLSNSEQIIFERSQALTDAFLLDLVYDKNIDKHLLEEQAEVLNLPDTSGLWQCVFLEIRALQNPIHTKQTVSSKLLQFLIINVMEDLFKGKFEYIAGRMDEADLLVALKCNNTDITQYQSAFYELIHICKTKLFCQVSIGVGQVVSEIVGLRLSFEEAADALQFRALHDKIGLHYYQVVENESQSALIFPNDAAFELVKELSDYGRSQAEKKQRVHQSILAFYAHFSQQRVSIHRLREHSFRLYFILLENVGQSVLSPDQLTDIQDRYSRLLSQNVYIKDFVVSVGALADELDLRIREIGSKSNMRIIQICKDYIGEHFAEDISLASVAKIVHLTPNYLSRLFKDLTGENFSEYINRYRIKEAVSLLQNKPSMKIYEVGEAVGLGNYKYFAQVFKKYTGTSPTQFKK